MSSLAEPTQVEKKPLALVTGGGKRVGKEIALHLASQGYSIGLHYYHSIEDAKSTAQKIIALGRECLLLNADLRQEIQVETFINSIDPGKYDLKILVNSAAIMPRSDLMKINSSEWDKLMDTNIKAVWLCCQKATRRMSEGGVIINLSDSGASKNWTGYGAYVISKAGVEVLTRILARELAPKIRVNAIAPGLLLRNESIHQEDWDQLVENVPLKREGDIAGLLKTVDLILKNEFITGETIHLDGGSLLG